MIAKCLLRQKTQKTLIFDYLIPENLGIETLSLVEVPFRNKKIEAIVLEIKPESKFARREILRSLSGGAVITRMQLEIAQNIAREFLSDLPTTIFSFLPKLNKKDLLLIGEQAKSERKQRIKKAIILTGDIELRQEYYIQSISKNGQYLLIFPRISDLLRLKKTILKINPALSVEIWHSQITSRTKATIMQKLLKKEDLIVLSTRHGLFLPFKNLELITLDDPSNFAYFEDQAPKYNAAHAARLISKLYKTQLIIGDSLPSLDSFAWIKSDKAIEKNRESNVRVRETFEIEKIFSDENFYRDFESSRHILVAGFFGNSDKYICADCGTSSSASARCSNCKSANLKTSFFDISKIRQTAFTIFNSAKNHHLDNKITVASFEDIPNLDKTFDIAVIPYFDYFASFPFLNFRFKLIKNIIDLKQTGVRTIYICLSKSPLDLADLLIKNDFEQLITQELKNRKHDNLPPFTRAIELLGNEKDIAKIKSIIDEKSWIGQDQDRYIAFVTHQRAKYLQKYIQATNKCINLRFDPPEFA